MARPTGSGAPGHRAGNSGPPGGGNRDGRTREVRKVVRKGRKRVAGVNSGLGGIRAILGKNRKNLGFRGGARIIG